MAASADSDLESRADSGFRANLSGANLPDLIQMECLALSSRAFRVTSGDSVGYLFFHEGQIVHAVTDDAAGEAAVFELLAWQKGTFEPCAVEKPTAHTITKSWQNLLILAAQSRDESGRSKLVNFPKQRSAPPRPIRPPPPTPNKNMPQRDANEVRDIVRLDASGNVLTAQGAGLSIAPVVAYAARMAELVGDELGLGKLVALEAQFNHGSILLHAERAGGVVALRTDNNAEASAVRRRFGL